MSVGRWKQLKRAQKPLFSIEKKWLISQRGPMVLLYDFICLRQVSAPETINCVGLSPSVGSQISSVHITQSSLFHLTQIVKINFILRYFLHRWSSKKVDDSYKLSTGQHNNNLHFLNAQSHNRDIYTLPCVVVASSSYWNWLPACHTYHNITYLNIIQSRIGWIQYNFT